MTDDNEENDILLCDMPDCNRAYHQLCLHPPHPPLPADEEEQEEDWNCPACRVREELLDVSPKMPRGPRDSFFLFIS